VDFLKMAHPRRASRDPLKGAMPSDRQSRIPGIPGNRHALRILDQRGNEETVKKK
jgi:hypothetical protein